MLFSFCLGADDTILAPYAPRIAKDLGPFLMVTSEDTLSLVLDTLSVVTTIDGSKWITPELANSLVLAMLEVWMKNNKGSANYFAIRNRNNSFLLVIQILSLFHLWVIFWE